MTKLELDIGSYVCDMHDVHAGAGARFKINDEDDQLWTIRKIIQVRIPFAQMVMNAMTHHLNMLPTNKHAIVVGETYDGLGYQCAYSYDGDRFGLFELVPYDSKENADG